MAAVKRLDGVEAHVRCGREPVALLQRIGQRVVEAVVGRVSDGLREGLSKPAPACARGPADHVVDRFAHQLARACLVEDGEARGDAGFERKALQQALGEGVNGLNGEPARRFRRAREERARARHLGCVGLAVQECEQGRLERIVRQHHPLGQAVKDTLRHLGGGGLRVGEAEDALGRRAGEEEAQDAHGQDVRLAGAGVGAHPDGGGGVGRVRLAAACALQLDLDGLVLDERRHG